MRCARSAAWPWLGLLLLASCAGDRVRAQDQRDHRIVRIDRPVLATEFSTGSRVFRVDREARPDGAAGFGFAIQLDEPGTPSPPAERFLEFPGSEASVLLVVAGDRGRPFWSRAARGFVRLRQFDERTLLVVDLEFRGPLVDDGLRIPPNVFREDVDRLRISGTFETEARARDR